MLGEGGGSMLYIDPSGGGGALCRIKARGIAFSYHPQRVRIPISKKSIYCIIIHTLTNPPNNSLYIARTYLVTSLPSYRLVSHRSRQAPRSPRAFGIV